MPQLGSAHSLTPHNFTHTVRHGSEGEVTSAESRSLMRTQRKRASATVGLLVLALVSTASPIAAAQDGNGNGNGNGHNGNGNDFAFPKDKKDPPAVSATPELGSLVLFGTGAAGVAGYALMRLRAGRRQDED